MKRWITVYVVLLLHYLSCAYTESKLDCSWKKSSTLSSSNGVQNSVVDSSSDNRYLSCRVKTISGLEGLIKNLTAFNAQNQNVNSLRLECFDNVLAESFLENENERKDFGAFNKHLNELVIQFCKIKHITSTSFKTFKSLKSLTLQTHNADWTTNNLDLHPETFNELTELRHLNLADNNIWTMPNGLFCPLLSLRHLNLSKNHINDISQIGFGASSTSSSESSNTRIASRSDDFLTGVYPSCNTGLAQLDLSYNNLISIPNRCFSALGSLNFLHLDSNQLTILDDNSFQGLERLQFLNISNNRLSALPPELFENTKELKRLYIGNNSLAVLAPGFFEKLSQLELLDLSHNELTSSWINRDSFVGLSRLILLKLNNNKLSKIDQFVFRELFNLQVLNLDYNAIEVIAQKAFGDLKNLRQLWLSNNNLRQIDSKQFVGLQSLDQLILESNEISSIHPNGFDDLNNVQDVSLNDNKLNKIPSSIKRLYKLQALDLGKNQIKEIERDSFEGLENLAGLRLTDNEITAITKDVLRPLQSIHVLNFASNKIKHIDQSAFRDNPVLRAIRLDGNQLEDISSAFTSLTSLVLLNVSNNNIKWFDFSHLPQSLEWVDIHNNSITELGNYYDATNQLRINYLDVSSNKIRKIKNDLIPKNITTLNLNNNLIDDIPSGTFLNRKHIRKIFIAGNMIKKMQIQSLVVAKFDVNREAPELYLAGNPLHCDCQLEWLRNINELSEQRRQLPKLMDMNNIKCTMEHNHEQKSFDDVAIKPFYELNSNDFLCKYENHCHTLCQCCQNAVDKARNAENDDDINNNGDDDEDELESENECKCRMTCPDQCSCYHDNTWNKNIVDCANANLQNLPLRIPIDVTTFYIDGNNLTHLSAQQFVGKNRLEYLYANNSNIHSIENGTFDEMKNLRVVHLNNNHLRKLHGYEFKELVLLNELYLNHNQLTHIGKSAFNHMKFLRIIDLSDNKLVDFNPINQLSASSKTGVLSQVYLDGDNKWNCDCKSLVQLIEWIKNRSNNFNVNRMLCLDNRIVGDVLNNCHLILNFRGINNNGGGSGGNGNINNRDHNSQMATPSSSLNSVHHQQHSTITYSGIGDVVGVNGGERQFGLIEYSACLAVAFIILASLFALGCICRKDVKLWVYSKYGVRLSSTSDGKLKRHSSQRCNHPNEHMNDEECFSDKVFDGYFVYSINDIDLLTQILLPELQNYGYQVSMYNHHNKPMMTRDNYQITNYLIDTLKTANDASHRMVIVVSFNFLQTEWCDPNFRCALQAVIDSMNRINKNIIIILTVPVEIVQMDPMLQLLIRTCTVVCWGEKRFWSKLRYALPDVSSDKKYITEGSKYGDNVLNFANSRYATAPTHTLQSQQHSRAGTLGPRSVNNVNDWYNLSPIGYSTPFNQYQQHQQPYGSGGYQQSPNNFSRTASAQQQQSQYDYEQPEYNAIASQGAPSLGGSSAHLNHVYSTIPETPPLSSSSNASSRDGSPALPRQGIVCDSSTIAMKNSAAAAAAAVAKELKRNNCDASNNDHFV
jgi:Leucine-rich repeat (LRR) protein